MSWRWIHSTAQVGLEKLQFAKASADALPVAPPSQRHLIDPVCYEDFEMHQALGVTGRVKAHVDKDFPAWAGIIVLRCGERALLKVRGEADIPLQPGLAVMFNAHRTHAVAQERTDVLVWLPVYDEDQPVHADELLGLAVEKYRPRTPPPSLSRLHRTSGEGGE